MRIPWYLMAKGKGGVGYKTASGPIVSVSDAQAAPLRSLVANIEPVQDLHGYGNPWPAGGSINKLPTKAYTGIGYNQPVGTILNPTESVNQWTDNGNGTFTISSLGDWAQAGFVSDVMPLGRVKGKLANLSGGLRISIYVCTEDYKINRVNTNRNPTTAGETINLDVTFVNDDARIVIYVAGSGGAASITNPMVYGNATSFDLPYSPYSNICPISGWSTVNVWVKPAYDPTANPTATIQLGQTVYGGTLDVANGVLTVDRVADTFTKDSAWYGFNTGSGNSSAVVQLSMYQNCKFVDGSASYNGSISSTGVEAPNYWIGARQNEVPTQGDMCFAYSSTGQLRFHRLDVASITDLESFKSAFPDTTICYPLATPITIPLTPTEISTLQGENNLWADSGDVTIEYLASGGTNADLMKLAVAFMGRK